MKKKCLLLFPPLAHPAQPYLSVPLLVGQLKKAGIEAYGKDLNVEFFNDILTKEYLEECIHNRKINSKTDSFFNKFEPEIYETVKNVENAVNTYKSDDFYIPEKLISAISTISTALKIVSLRYFPTEISFGSYVNPKYSLSYEDVKAFCLDKDDNIFLNYFEKIINEINKNKIDFVAISIPYTTQVVPALTLAYLIKQNTKAHINIGGNLISRIADTFCENQELFDLFVDTVTIGDGEYSIVDLVKNLDDYSNIPGIIYKKETIFKNTNNPIMDLKELAPPDYAGYDFKKYFSPEIIITLQFSKGCYYGKCSFCDFFYGKPSFVHKSIKQIVDEIEQIQKKYNVDKFEFADEAIPPSLMKKIAEEIISRNLNIKYFVMARTEKDFTKELLELLYNSGIRMMNWGIEAASERILKLMNKGVDTNDRLRLLKDSNNTGIWNHTYVIIGFPTETEEEIKETIDFYTHNREIIHSFNSQTFVTNKHSTIKKSAEAFCIKVEGNKNFQPNYAYKDKIMSAADKTEFHKKFKKTYIESCGLGLWQVILPDEYLFLYVNRFGKEKLENYKIGK